MTQNKLIIHVAIGKTIYDGVSRVELLCGKDYKDLEHRYNIWDTAANILKEPVQQDEEMCPDCVNHPDYPLHTLAGLDK